MLYAHKDIQKGKSQELMEHLVQVGALMKQDMDYLEFPGISKEELERIFYDCGENHDTGKATTFFQEYLDGIAKVLDKKNHSYLSAVIYSHLYDSMNFYAGLGFLSILKHHSDMNLDIAKEGQEFTYLPEKYENWLQNMSIHYQQKAEGRRKSITGQQIQEYIEDFKDIQSLRYRSDQWFFALQYIFSKLIWADKMNSSETQGMDDDIFPELSDIDRYIHSKSKGQQGRCPKNDPTINLEEVKKKDEKQGEKQDFNEDRDEIRRAILAKIASLSDEELKKQRIFTITSPTGSGKTLSSMSAAILLSRRLEKIYGRRPKIIVALPFINILEQTRMDYEALFPNVLVNHSLEDFTIIGKEDSPKEAVPLSKSYLLSNSWEADVVITTFVQFFESIFTGKNKSLLKLNKLSRSIVILDEIQALPAEYYGLIGVAIKRISEYYGTRFIMMTATKPEIVYFAKELLCNEDLPNKKLLKDENNTSMTTVELLEEHALYYQKLCRTQLIPVMDRVRNELDLTEFIKQTRKEGQSAVIVMNTIKTSITNFNLLKKIYARECPVLYLSTNLISIDRKEVIKRAKELEKSKKPFILVSTQTIEAGVDLDFDLGYRDLAPLESIVQVAGRVNRAGRKGDFAPVYIFDSGDWQKIYGVFAMSHTKDMLCRGYREDQYKDLIEKYYDGMKSGMRINEEIYNEGILKLDYSVIEKFKMIEKKYEVYKIIIEKDDIIGSLLSELVELYKSADKSFDTKLRINRLLNKIGSYTVEVSPSKVKRNTLISFHSLYGIDLNMFIVPKENVADYYDETGYIFDEEEWQSNIFF